MTCTSKLRRLPADPHETVNRVCCTFVRRVVPYVYQPETIDLLDTIGIVDDGTIYFASTAYAITGNEIWLALDTFVIATKNVFGLTLGSSTLQNQFKFIYPRIGGTATAHKYNLVDTTAFEGIFSGGWTHDGSGALPNGTNAYMDTQCAYTGANFTQNSQSFGFDSKTNANALYADFGAANTGNADVNMYGRLSGNLNTRLGDSVGNSTSPTSDSLGVLSINRVSATEYKQYQEGTPVGTETTNSTIFSGTPYNILEGATNNTGSPIQYSARKRTLFFGGLGMTDQQMSDFVSAWNTFETTLNR